jgi:hypothetical protein
MFKHVGATGLGLFVPLVLAGGLARAQSAPAARPVDFIRDIRPMLSETCFSCHGPDQNRRKADLRLDSRQGAFQDRGGYAAIVPGKPDESEVYLRLSTEDPDERMPPPKAVKRPTRAQIELIKRWIEQGAVWRDHWAYVPPVRPAVPALAAGGPGPGFARNAIDHFILAKLAEQGLRPSPEADRVTLIRRLSFDLTGLPPTPDEVDVFVNDTSAEAYERLVDRLLGSLQYGERMAIYWLDLVRYADTDGYHGDNHRDVALFRDYVIRAFNENRPFNRFTIEQIAGDLLPHATIEDKVASGYNRLLMTTREGGAQAKEYQAKYAADRVRNASTVWLGTTLGCTECHDHKYDPFLTRDFYGFAAFFADIKEIAVGIQEPTKIPSPEQSERLRRLDEQAAALRKVLDTQTPELNEAQGSWEWSIREHRPHWTTLWPTTAASRQGTTLKVLADGSLLASGPNPATDTYTVTLGTPLTGITALRLEVLPDDSLPRRGLGRSAQGDFALTDFELAVNGKPVPLASATASQSPQGFDALAVADGKPETGWSIQGHAGQPQHAVFETGIDFGEGGEGTLTLTLRQERGGQRTIGRFRLSATTAPRPVRAEPWPRSVGDILAVRPSRRTETQRRELAAYYRGIAPALEPTRHVLAGVKRRREQLEATIPTMLVSTSIEPRAMRILPRGNWLDDSGPLVAPSVPVSLAPLKVNGRRANRLDLAGWLVARDNPLVARVFVNRLWKLMFGQGIVATLDDFGSQGAPPTHPELLDWLAAEFVDSGWDVKHLLKLMATSGTYRQSSHANESLRQRDPYNRWLARQGRFRLDAELVRDNALAVSGLLALHTGGPSVKPYQPAGYWSHMNFPVREYQSDHGESLYRRSLYTYWCRTFLHPSLLAFDASTREECTVERPRSNTPLQALVLLNDPIYVEAARACAERILRAGGVATDDAESRLRLAFRLALSRPPRPAESQLLTVLYRKHLAHYRADHKAADSLVHVGERPVPTDLDTAELAAWTSVARVIFNLHEFITRN